MNLLALVPKIVWVVGTSLSLSMAEEFTGDGTGYVLSPPSAGNCNFMFWPDAAVDNYVAMNDEQYESSHACGKCIEVGCADPQCTSTAKEILYVMDRCPECKKGELDLPPAVFKRITGTMPGRLKVSWRFVDCPVSGNIKICLKSGSNAYWTAIQPVNMIAGVQSMTINGRKTDMVASSYYYKVETSGGMDMTNVKLTLTSVSGETVETSVSLADSTECTATNVQFAPGSGGAAGQSSASTSSASTTAPVTTIPATTTPDTTLPMTTPSSNSPTLATIGPSSSESMDALMESIIHHAGSNSDVDASTTTTPPVATVDPSSAPPSTSGAAKTEEPAPTKAEQQPQDNNSSQKIVTKSKGSSGTSPFFLALMGLVAVVGVALVVVAYRVKQKKLDDKRNDRRMDAMDFRHQHQLSTPEPFSNV